MRTRALLALLCFTSLAPALAAKDAVTIAFDATAVTASVTPGASTAWFSISHDHRGAGMALVHRAQLLEDQDRDGTVRLDLEGPVSAASFWMVVDMKSGAYAVDGPFPAAFRRGQLPPGALHARGDGKLARLAHGGRMMTVCVVRPGVGAWLARVDDGTPKDGDGALDGNVALLLHGLQPVGTSPAPPDELLRDDVVIIAEPLSLSVLDGRAVK